MNSTIHLRVKRKMFLLVASFISKLIQLLFSKYAEPTITLLPKNYEFLISVNSKLCERWSIVIQGPILNNKHLQYLQSNLLKLRGLFPGATIILSSYNQYRNMIELIPNTLIDEKIFLDESSYKNNFERQVASSYAGIECAKKYRKEFTLKLRTDQMIRHPATLILFTNLLESQRAEIPYKKKIIASSFNSWLYRPFGVSDMLTAGYYEDVSAYWEFNKEITDFHLSINNPPSWFRSSQFFYETFLAVRFLLVNKFVFTENVFFDTAKMYKDHVIIVDSATIGHSWFKRGNVWNGNSIIKSGYNLPNASLIEISHSDWLCLRSGNYAIAPNNRAAMH